MRFVFIFILLFSCSKLFRKEKVEQREDYTLRTKAYQYGPTQLGPSNYFKDKTTEYGLEGIKANRIYAIDFSLDGSTDLVFLEDDYSAPKFYQYSKQEKRFKHVPSLFSEPVIASYILFYDLNHDNILDAIVGVLNQKDGLTKIPLKVFEGKVIKNRLSFSEVKGAIKIKPTSSSTVSILDFDNDGHLDLFVGNWFENYKGKPVAQTDILLKGNGFSFKNVSDLLVDEYTTIEDGIMYINARPTYGASTCDIDQNGFTDILTTSTSRYNNKLWMNIFTLKGVQRKFKDLGLESYYGSDVEGRLDPRGGGRSFFSACADYNNDGMIDIYMGELTHSYDHSSVDKSSILTGSFKKYPPEFIRTEYMNDITTINWNQGDRRGIWFDYNFDGLLDLLVDNSGFPPTSRLVLFKQNEDHSFENIGHLAGIDIINPIGSVVADINQDGKLDIITGQTSHRNSDISNRIYFFENNIPFEGKRSIRFFLRGKEANSQGISSMVYLQTKKGEEEKTQMKWAEFSQGALPSQNEEGMYFGIGASEKLIQVKVRWPAKSNSQVRGRKALEREYNLSNYHFKFHLDITLCDSGRHFQGLGTCD